MQCCFFRNRVLKILSAHCQRANNFDMTCFLRNGNINYDDKYSFIRATCNRRSVARYNFAVSSSFILNIIFVKYESRRNILLQFMK